jgi:hypothetical protein
LHTSKKLHQAVVSMRLSSGNLQTFAMETDDQAFRQMCNDYSKQLNQMASELSNRIKSIEKQHPEVDLPDHEMQTW